MSQQLIDQAERLSQFLPPINGNSRTHAHELAADYPRTQAEISKPSSTLVEILQVMSQEFQEVHPNSPQRDVDQLGHQLISALLRRGVA